MMAVENVAPQLQIDRQIFLKVGYRLYAVGSSYVP